MYGKTTEIANEVQEGAKELAGGAKDEVKEIAGEAEEAIDWVVQTIVLALCGGFLVMVLGILLLMLAIV